jgi:hypothetical protein
MMGVLDFYDGCDVYVVFTSPPSQDRIIMIIEIIIPIEGRMMIRLSILLMAMGVKDKNDTV